MGLLGITPVRTLLSLYLSIVSSCVDQPPVPVKAIIGNFHYSKQPQSAGIDVSQCLQDKTEIIDFKCLTN